MLFAAIVLAGCKQPAAQDIGKSPTSGPAITAAVVIEKFIAESQEFSGRLEAVDQVELRPQVSGFIATINFKPGTAVKKGEVLFIIDPRQYQAEVNRAEAAMLAARAKTDLAKIELARAEKLLAERAIAQREAEQKASSVKELEANMRAAQASYDAAKLNLEFTQVRSPINGRVSKAEVTAGNLVDRNVKLTTVVSSNPIYASFDGDEDTYLRVSSSARKDAPVTVRIGLANETGYSREGKLEFVDNRVDPNTGSVRMRAIFSNDDNALAPGLFARVQLAGSTDARTKTLMISNRAIGTDQNRKFVYIVNAENKVEYRQVKLGPLIDGLRVVRDGLRSGEKIVVNGLQRVKPGSPITAQLVPMDADSSTLHATQSKPAAVDESKVGLTSESVVSQ